MDLRHARRQQHIAKHGRKAEKALREKDHDDQADGQQQLRARVEAVDEGVAGEVLADGDIFQHFPTSRSMAARTSSMR